MRQGPVRIARRPDSIGLLTVFPGIEQAIFIFIEGINGHLIFYPEVNQERTSEARGQPDEIDQKDAKETVRPLVAAIPGCRYVDGGPLANSRTVEAVTALLVGINIRYKAHSGIRITGV